MMLLTKLKAVAVTVLTLAALSGGLGLGLVPAYANTRGEEPAASAKAAVLQPANPTDRKILERLDQIITAKWTEEVDDATFLRRLSLDLRGLLPTPVEAFFFIADDDKDKRNKVVTWMVDDDSVKAYAAKRLNIDARRIRAARLVDAGDGKARHLVVVLDVEVDGKPHAVAFSPDGKMLAVELTADGRPITPMVVALRHRPRCGDQSHRQPRRASSGTIHRQERPMDRRWQHHPPPAARHEGPRRRFDLVGFADRRPQEPEGTHVRRFRRRWETRHLAHGAGATSVSLERSRPGHQRDC